MLEITAPIQRIISTEWMLIPLFCVLVSYALIRHLKTDIVGDSLRYFFSFRLANQTFRNVGSQSIRLTYALMLNSFLSISILLFKLISPFFSTINVFILFFILLGGIMILFLVKKVIIHLIGNITETSEIMKIAQIYSAQYYQIIGLLLLPGIIAILFFPQSNNLSLFGENINIGYLYSIFIISILYLFRVLQSIWQSFDIKVSWSYIILYLCTLEILPLVVIYRLLVGEIWMFN